MIISDKRWENGSFYHWFGDWEPTEASASPWDDNGVYYASGRDAFRAILNYGQAERNWKRFWVPCYYCQEVVKSFVSTGIEVALYADGPEDAAPSLEELDFKPGDVLLRVNFFGLRDSLRADGIDRERVEVIDDHTHDPWADCAWHSDADWCVTSLRKVFPVPDGGVLWSPRNVTMPLQPNVTDTHRETSLEKIAAMVLKGLYLQGHPIEKDIFRQLSISAEDRMASGDVSGMPPWTARLLRGYPTEAWRRKRQANHRTLSQALDGVPGLRVLQPTNDTKSCPLAGIVVLESPGWRDHVRSELVRQSIYPTVLWELDKPAIPGIPPKYLHLSHTMFTIHCDMRYSTDDMERVAGLIREFAGSLAKT